jgi:DNA-binding transcriptional ArsR family regulator
MGSLFDDIKKEQMRKGNRSRIAEILETLPEDEKKDFIKALDDHSIPASNISKALEKRGIRLAINVISRYRRGELATKIK